MQMPEMDGFAAMSQIRQDELLTGRHLPIIALTAHSMKGDQERCLAAGADKYVPKPIQIEELLSAIELFLVDGTGFEPATPALRTPCSPS